MVSGELEQSLRGAVDEYINTRLRGLQEEITRLQSQVNEAFAQLAERASGEADADTSVAASISEHIRAAHERGIEDAAAESARTRASSTTWRSSRPASTTSASSTRRPRF